MITKKYDDMWPNGGIGYMTATVKDANGKVCRRVDCENLQEIEGIYCLERPSGWGGIGDYVDSVTLFKAKTSNGVDVIGAYEHIPGGYSEYTYIPDELVELVLTDDLAVAERHLLTDSWRDYE